MSKKYIASFLTILVLILTLSSCGVGPAYAKSGFYFDTLIYVELTGPQSDEAVEKCMVMASTYDKLFNKNNINSDVYKINHSEGKYVEVSEDTIELINIALSWAYESDGLFDPTIGTVSSLWNFSSDPFAVPDKSSIYEALSHVNYKNVLVEESKVKLTDSETCIDLGAIAKGYVADKMKEALKDYDIKYGFINLGGNVLTINSKPGDTPFNIGIKDPEIGGDGGNITNVKVNDKSVVTSGIYERYAICDEKVYHHILDTKTGYPIRNNLLSVSIIGPSSATCDALSTILYIKGIEEGSEFLKNYPDYEAVFITDTKDIIYR